MRLCVCDVIKLVRSYFWLMKFLERIFIILHSFIGLWLKLLILRNRFHWLEGLFYLSQVLGSDLIYMTQLIIWRTVIVVLRRKKFGNRSHILRTMQVILMEVILKLFEGMFKGKFIKQVFSLKKLGEKLVLGFSSLVILIGVFLNEQNEFPYHVSLRAIKILMLIFWVSILARRIIAVFIVIGVIFGQVCIHPYFNFSSPCYEYHLLHDIKISHFFVQHFKSVKGWFVHVQKVIKRNVVDLF